VSVRAFLIFSNALFNLFNTVFIFFESLIVRSKRGHDLVVKLRFINVVDLHIEGDREAHIKHILLCCVTML
jgi:hypothetical protein